MENDWFPMYGQNTLQESQPSSSSAASKQASKQAMVSIDAYRFIIEWVN